MVGYLIEDPCFVIGVTSMVMYGNSGRFHRSSWSSSADSTSKMLMLLYCPDDSPEMHPLALTLKVL